MIPLSTEVFPAVNARPDTFLATLLQDLRQFYSLERTISCP